MWKNINENNNEKLINEIAGKRKQKLKKELRQKLKKESL